MAQWHSWLFILKKFLCVFFSEYTCQTLYPNPLYILANLPSMHECFCMWPQLEVFFSLEPRRGHCGCSCNGGWWVESLRRLWQNYFHGLWIKIISWKLSDSLPICWNYTSALCISTLMESQTIAYGFPKHTYTHTKHTDIQNMMYVLCFKTLWAAYRGSILRHYRRAPDAN